MPSTHPFEKKLGQSWPPAQWKDLTVLLAVSGGADSIALLRAVLALRRRGQGDLVVAHYNHRWRAAESDADEAFVVELCDRHDLQCECSRAENSGCRGGNSLEAAARRQRYHSLQQTAQRIGARYIATAHTADDQAETILHRIVRGTGLSGLAGIPRTRRLNDMTMLIRPLLDVRRAELVAYLDALGQAYRDDASNRDLRFTRNRIRADLLPRLQTDYNQQVVEALLRLGSLAGQSQRVIDSLVCELIDHCVTRQGEEEVVIDCGHIAATEPYLIRELLIAIWKDRGWPLQAMSYDKWDSLAEMMATDTGVGEGSKQSLPGEVCGEKKDGALWLRREDR